MIAYELVVVGASWGGLAAVRTIVAALPADFALPIVLAQHRHTDSAAGVLTQLLQQMTPLKVCEAGDKDPILPGRVHLAPPDYHLLIEPGRFALSTDVRVQFARPSIDVLFESASDVYGPGVVGVILTGANDDGAAGLARIKQRGGYAIVQDPADAEKPEMPTAALAATPVDAVLPLAAIAPALVELAHSRAIVGSGE